MRPEPVFPLSANRNLSVISPQKRQADLPSWDIASRLVFPFLEQIPRCSGTECDFAARNPSDILSAALTGYVKMSIALFYRGAVIPLTESLVREWAVSMASVYLAMDANLALVTRSSRLERHESGRIRYYTVHSDAAPFNSALPFYKPFQEMVSRELGFPFYFAVPERRTVVLLGQESLPSYWGALRNDVLLTRDTSSSALSPELIEVSESGVFPVCE